MINRKLIRDKLKKLINKQILINIYYVLKSDDNFIYTSNNNGLFFDINLLDNNTIEKIDIILKENDNNNNLEPLIYEPYKTYQIKKYDDFNLMKQLKKFNL
jgi:hypothetical protein